MTLSRLPQWRNALIAYLAEAARTPFQEGIHDCALFLAGGVAAMTGVDYAAPYRGRYTTTRGGVRILRKDGYADHVALALHHLAEKPVALAREGDGAVHDGPEAPALGIVQGENIYVLQAQGLALIPLTRARTALEV